MLSSVSASSENIPQSLQQDAIYQTLAILALSWLQTCVTSKHLVIIISRHYFIRSTPATNIAFYQYILYSGLFHEVTNSTHKIFSDVKTPKSDK